MKGSKRGFKTVNDTMTRTELALLNMHGLKIDKRENLIADAHEYLETELKEIEGVNPETAKESMEFILLCAKKVENENNSPESLKEMLYELVIGGENVIENTDEPKDVDDFLDLLGMMEELCFFLSHCPQNEDDTKKEYVELSEKAGEEKSRLEFEQYKAMGGEGTLDEYLAEIDTKTTVGV